MFAATTSLNLLQPHRRWQVRDPRQYAADYPKGPTTSPRACASLWLPAGGLSHAAHGHHPLGLGCCVYGLTFTSHFYGARRSVGYVPFNSESLVTGKLFEDIRDAVYAQADPAQFDAIVIINLCVPTASGVPCSCCPKRSMAFASSASMCPALGCQPMPEAKDVLAGANASVRHV